MIKYTLHQVLRLPNCILNRAHDLIGERRLMPPKAKPHAFGKEINRNHFNRKKPRLEICNTSSDIIFGKLKIDEDEIFYKVILKRCIKFLLRMTQILHIPKIIFGDNTLRFVWTGKQVL